MGSRQDICPTLVLRVSRRGCDGRQAAPPAGRPRAQDKAKAARPSSVRRGRQCNKCGGSWRRNQKQRRFVLPSADLHSVSSVLPHGQHGLNPCGKPDTERRGARHHTLPLCPREQKTCPCSRTPLQLSTLSFMPASPLLVGHSNHHGNVLESNTSSRTMSHWLITIDPLLHTHVASPSQLSAPANALGHFGFSSRHVSQGSAGHRAGPPFLPASLGCRQGPFWT